MKSRAGSSVRSRSHGSDHPPPHRGMQRSTQRSSKTDPETPMKRITPNTRPRPDRGGTPTSDYTPPSKKQKGSDITIGLPVEDDDRQQQSASSSSTTQPVADAPPPLPVEDRAESVASTLPYEDYESADGEQTDDTVDYGPDDDHQTFYDWPNIVQRSREPETDVAEDRTAEAYPVDFGEPPPLCISSDEDEPAEMIIGPEMSKWLEPPAGTARAKRPGDFYVVKCYADGRTDTVVER